jgi:hypothetical protein
MSLAVDVSMFTLAVMALAIRSLHYACCAYATARMAMSMSIPITKDRWEHNT